MILVTGATGNVGRELTALLPDARTLTRGSGVDLAEPETLTEPTPFAEARAQLAAEGRSPASVEALIGSAERRPRSELVTSSVQELTGRPARTFRVWADRNAAAFG